MSNIPDLSGSSGCRALQAPFLSQQGLEVLLFPASQAFDREIMPVLVAFAPAKVCMWSEHLFSWSFPFAGECFTFAASSFYLRFPRVLLRSEVVIRSWCAGIHSWGKDSPIVSLLCCQVHFFNDLTIVCLHFCLCKLNWSLASAGWGEREMALLLLKGTGWGRPLC